MRDLRGDHYFNSLRNLRPGHPTVTPDVDTRDLAIRELMAQLDDVRDECQECSRQLVKAEAERDEAVELMRLWRWSGNTAGADERYHANRGMREFLTRYDEDHPAVPGDPDYAEIIPEAHA